MTTDFSNKDNIIDTRDIVKRLEYLEAECADEPDVIHKASAEDREEMAMLQKLVEEVNGYAGDDCKDGVTLIRDSHFQDYARELAEDIGAVKPDAQWPYTCIDWEQAAEELQMDYTSVEFDGVTYWFR